MMLDFWVCFSKRLVYKVLITYCFRRKILFKKWKIKSTEIKKRTENNLENKIDKKTIICYETNVSLVMLSQMQIYLLMVNISAIFYVKKIQLL